MRFFQTSGRHIRSITFYATLSCFFAFLVVSCSKNNLDDMNQPIYAMQTAHSDVALGPKPDPVEDCKCYMTVTNVRTSNGSPLTGCSWSVEQLSNPFPPFTSPWAINGSGNTYAIAPSTSYQPLPSPPIFLQPFSNSVAYLLFAYTNCGLINEPSLIIDTKIECFLTLNGTETRMTDTYQSTTIAPQSDNVLAFPTSCYSLTDGRN